MASLQAGWVVSLVEGGSHEHEITLPVHLPELLGESVEERDVWLERTLHVETRSTLHLARIGPLADVYVDGTLALSTRNLFRSYALPLEPGMRRVSFHLRSPAQALREKRPRPKWKTRLVANQQLRWLRTPLLGRIPSWSPTGAPRGVYDVPLLAPRTALHLPSVRVHATCADGHGRVEVFVPAHEATCVVLHVGGARAELQRTEDGWRGYAEVPEPRRWWPHTHGEPARHAASLEVDGEHHALPPVGFRTVAAREGARFGIRINDVDVFCRGGVWVPRLDEPGPDLAATRTALETLRDAGANMIRVGGTMRYESAAFFELCDELGLLVWQDFMLANMDYPVEDPAFAAEITAEVDEQLERWAAHPCIAVVCGGSEVAQQASMVGQPEARWYGPLFEVLLPERCRAALPEVPYVLGSPSSPPGILPFRVDAGVAHYYGVGAYERPFTDVRLADVTFASECLGLSNVPEPDAIDAMFGDEPPATHTPRWKAGVPRDNGSGWDFEDVRDHYFRELFAIDPVSLRYADTDGYLERSRIVSGEVMARVFGEWRRHGSTTGGGLVWFLRDLFPGAGWGLLDERGVAKAALLMLKDAWAPTSLFFTDEGVNGVRVHLVHEGREPRALTLKLSLHRAGGTVAEVTHAFTSEPRSTAAHDLDLLLGGFRDAGHAYRFGPRTHDVVLGSLWEGAQRIAGASFIPALPTEPPDAGLVATIVRTDPRTCAVTVGATHLALYTVVRVPGWHASHGYFHLAAGESRVVSLRAPGAAGPPRGYVHALGSAPVKVSA